MKIDLIALPLEGQTFEGEESAEALNWDGGGVISVKSPLQYRIFAQIVSDMLLANGRLSMEAETACSRCGTTFPVSIRESTYHYDEEVDADTEYVDLTEDMRAAMICAFPSYPVCREECAGVCSQCGVDLNEGTCKCRPPEENQWSALDNLDRSE
jgi:uncharacterized protein